MKHITVDAYGTKLSLVSERLKLASDKKNIEVPLNRIKTISIMNNGSSISTDLITKSSLYGIKIFFFNRRNNIISSISNYLHHGVSKSRENQYEHLLKDKNKIILTKQILQGKISNQRSTLLYINKNRKYSDIYLTAKKLQQIKYRLTKYEYYANKNWLNNMLGYEGIASKYYWDAIIKTELFPISFQSRIGRGALDITNKALNYGYAILESYITNALINAGLEIHYGIFHVNFAGRRSLTFDIMEEYRSWVVDRNIFKIRQKLKNEKNQLSKEVRQNIIELVHNTFAKKYPYKNKKIKLENILQRQIYKLNGHFAESKNYKPYKFKW